jgi:hypothetical protein
MARSWFLSSMAASSRTGLWIARIRSSSGGMSTICDLDVVICTEIDTPDV